MNGRGRLSWSGRAESARGLNLLVREALIRTGPTDKADWNFRFFLKSIQRLRFRLALELLGRHRFRRLLEVGYGSGIFLPALAPFAVELYGVDIHPHWAAVQTVLESWGIKAHLFQGSVTELGRLFAREMFDAVVSVSTLEYVSPIDKACRQIRQVMTASGLLVVVTPGDSPVLDWLLKLLTGESAEANYGRRRQGLLPALKQEFDVKETRLIPRIFGYSGAVYRALALTPRIGPPESKLAPRCDG